MLQQWVNQYTMLNQMDLLNTYADLSTDAALVVDGAQPEGVGDAHEGVLLQLPQPIQQLLRRVPE